MTSVHQHQVTHLHRIHHPLPPLTAAKTKALAPPALCNAQNAAMLASPLSPMHHFRIQTKISHYQKQLTALEECSVHTRSTLTTEVRHARLAPLGIPVELEDKALLLALLSVPSHVLADDGEWCTLVHQFMVACSDAASWETLKSGFGLENLMHVEAGAFNAVPPLGTPPQSLRRPPVQPLGVTVENKQESGVAANANRSKPGSGSSNSITSAVSNISSTGSKKKSVSFSIPDAEDHSDLSSSTSDDEQDDRSEKDDDDDVQLVTENGVGTGTAIDSKPRTVSEDVQSCPTLRPTLPPKLETGLVPPKPALKPSSAGHTPRAPSLEVAVEVEANGAATHLDVPGHYIAYELQVPLLDRPGEATALAKKHLVGLPEKAQRILEQSREVLSDDGWIKALEEAAGCEEWRLRLRAVLGYEIEEGAGETTNTEEEEDDRCRGRRLSVSTRITAGRVGTKAEKPGHLEPCEARKFTGITSPRPVVVELPPPTDPPTVASEVSTATSMGLGIEVAGAPAADGTPNSNTSFASPRNLPWNTTHSVREGFAPAIRSLYPLWEVLGHFDHSLEDEEAGSLSDAKKTGGEGHSSDNTGVSGGLGLSRAVSSQAQQQRLICLRRWVLAWNAPGASGHGDAGSEVLGLAWTAPPLLPTVAAAEGPAMYSGSSHTPLTPISSSTHTGPASVAGPEVDEILGVAPAVVEAIQDVVGERMVAAWRKRMAETPYAMPH